MPGDSHRPSHDEIGLFSLALARLDEALDVADRDPGNTVVRDGLIKRFEFTYEMAIRCLRYRLRQGAHPNAGQFGYRTTVRFAADAGLVQDPEAWIVFTNSRQNTTHDYNEPVAVAVAVAVGVAATIPNFARHARLLLDTLSNALAFDL